VEARHMQQSHLTILWKVFFTNDLTTCNPGDFLMLRDKLIHPTKLHFKQTTRTSKFLFYSKGDKTSPFFLVSLNMKCIKHMFTYMDCNLLWV
jgi:hypothetical protein